jgi:hypothetical protein
LVSISPEKSLPVAVRSCLPKPRAKPIINDILTSSETNTDEAIALGIDISKTANYKEGQLNTNKVKRRGKRINL